MSESAEALAEKVRKALTTPLDTQLLGPGIDGAAALVALDALLARLAEAEKQIAKWQRVADGIERVCQVAEADRNRCRDALKKIVRKAADPRSWYVVIARAALDPEQK